MPAHGADLLLDQVVVVEEPLGGRRDPPATRHRAGQKLVSFAEQLLIVGEAAKKAIGTPAAADAYFVPTGQRLGVAIQLIDAV